MPIPNEYSFQRYLAAKKSLDDRSLNRHVWGTLESEISRKQKDAPFRILEIGAGIGTMIERVIEWDLVSNACYTAVDIRPENLQTARQRLVQYAGQNGLTIKRLSEGQTHLFVPGKKIIIEFKPVDFYNYFAHTHTEFQYDLIIAHAFLDLVEISRALPVLFKLLVPEGLFFFSMIYDGLTILEPPVDPELDGLILELYHRTMDERLIDGSPSGDSRTGRHLFKQLMEHGAHILDIGASDWVVFPEAGGYPVEEAYFLHFIIHTIHKSLEGKPQLEKISFDDWAKKRHQQIELRQLFYIAHQLDYVGKVQSSISQKI